MYLNRKALDEARKALGDASPEEGLEKAIETYLREIIPAASKASQMAKQLTSSAERVTQDFDWRDELAVDAAAVLTAVSARESLYRDALGRIAQVVEDRDWMGLCEFRPAVSADAAQQLAFRTLASTKEAASA